MDLSNRLTKSLGFQQITSLSAATALTVPTGTIVALIQADVANVRWRDDGTDPTASIGMRLPIGAELAYEAALSKLKFIQESPGAILNITYFA